MTTISECSCEQPLEVNLEAKVTSRTREVVSANALLCGDASSPSAVHHESTETLPKLLRLKNCLKRYDVGPTKFYELLNSGAIPWVRWGRVRLIDREAADAWFESQYKWGRE